MQEPKDATQQDSGGLIRKMTREAEGLGTLFNCYGDCVCGIGHQIQGRGGNCSFTALENELLEFLQL